LEGRTTDQRRDRKILRGEGMTALFGMACLSKTDCSG
jgi:hypothetical protein